MLVQLLLYVVAVVVDDVNVVDVVRVRVIFAFMVVCGVGIVGDVADIVQQDEEEGCCCGENFLWTKMRSPAGWTLDNGL